MQLERRQANASGDAPDVPVPQYILRGHTSQINTLHFSKDNKWLLSGDSDGFVAIWSLESLRPVIFVKAHENSVLTVSTLGKDKFLTHGRDNKIHVFSFAEDLSPSYQAIPSPAQPTSLEPLYTIETNALGYCKCSVLELPGEEGLVAVPATLHDGLIDIFQLPSGKRVFRSVGKDFFDTKTGTMMALSLDLQDARTLRLLTAYEDGRVACFTYYRESGDWTLPVMGEGEGWTKAFESREHKEPAMGLSLDPAGKRAWSVAGDNLVVRYELTAESEQRSRAYKTAYPGRAGLAVRNDGRILAIAGWDGFIRVHSAKTFKPLAVLEYHRESVYCVAFADVLSSSDDVSASQKNGSKAWLAAAGKDERISLWELYSPS